MAKSENSISRSSSPSSNQEISNRLGTRATASHNRRVLAVDDDTNVTSGIASNLHGRFTVMTANSGTEALDILSEHGPFAVVLSDLRMPSMDGIELLRRVRHQYPETIRIMLSGNADLAATIQAVNSGGIQHLLLKPSSPEELRNVLENACAEFDRQAKERALALEDPMLGIGTRRALDRAMPRIHSHSVRYQRAYALAMVDVDNFKRYNDNYGHPAGDRALYSVARAIATTCRASDEVFRFGGEEIVLLFPDTDERSAFIACERIRANVQQLAISHPCNESGFLTISLGISASTSVARPDVSELLEQADKALYHAKAQGRNRVVSWQSISEAYT
jgi:diguanylate cyclase (GGDEF)-like protein